MAGIGVKSLKQLIADNVAELAVVKSDITGLIGGDVDLTNLINANKTNLEGLTTTANATQSDLVALTSTANATQSALDTATVGFTDELSRIDSDIAGITAVDGPISANANAIGTVSNNLSILTQGPVAANTQGLADELVARAAEVARIDSDIAGIVAVDGPVAANTTAIDTVSNNLVLLTQGPVATNTQGLADELVARADADKKICFAHTMEFDGLLEDNTFPFSMGNGAPSDAEFGVQLPMNATLVAWGLSAMSARPAQEFYTASSFFDIIHYPAPPEGSSDPVAGVVVASIDCSLSGAGLVRDRKYAKLGAANMVPGDIVIRAHSVTGAVSLQDRFRITLYFQSLDVLT